MKLKIFFILISLSVVIMPSEAIGLRKIKPGDKIPVSGALKVFQGPQTSAPTAGKKLIFYYKSGDTRSTAFMKTLTKVLQEMGKQAKDITLFLVDGNGDGLSRDESSSRPCPEVRIGDKERLIYGELGVIVIPSLILVNPDHTLHSLTAGLRHNLDMLLRGYLHALIAGKKPGNLYQETDRNIAIRKTGKMLKQAFLLMMNKNFQLAATMYRKALKSDPAHGEALLGIGYALLMDDNIDDATAYFTQLKEKQQQTGQPENTTGQLKKRVLLGYWLCKASKEPNAENLEMLGKLAMLEPNFFMVLYRAGEILQKEKNYKLSSTVYRRGFKVLLRKVRRSKTK